MKKLYHIAAILFLFALSISPLAHSQNFAKNWLFGDFGLEFKSDTVLIRHDYAPHESRGMGIISDKNGNLICYTNGFNIWNRNHVIMPNGKDVLSAEGSPLIQESIIIPLPGSEKQYYVFTVDAYNGQAASGLYYSVVDLNLDNGLGNVTLKGKKILNNTTNKITAVYHNNKKDVWIVTHQYDTNKYYAYLLTEAGLTETPVISSVGNSSISSFAGQLKASPDGTKMACSYDDYTSTDDFTLFDFNNSTGRFTNPLLFTLPVTYRGGGGLEFSPDAKKLFVYQSGSTGESGLYQFDISSGTYAGINNSRTLVFQDMVNGLFQMQLAPNGKIYFTKGGGQDSGTKYLGVVENPNEWGNNCTVKELGLYLDGSSAFTNFTPNFIQNYFFKTSFTFDNACSGNLTDFQISNESGLDSVKWNFGQGSTSISRHPQFKYNEAGKYTVTLLAYYPTKTDTVKKQITINPSPRFNLGNDTTVCFGYELSAAIGFKSYHWNTGDSTHSVIIKKAGIYKLTVENEYGCLTTDSVFLNVAALPVIDLPDSIQLGTLDSIPVNAGNFKSYMWSTGETTSSINVKKEGWYSVTVENETGCTATKPFYVYINKQTNEDTEWKFLNPQPSALAGLDICFLNSQVGYILNNSQIIGTADGGTTWKVLMRIASGKRMAFKNNYGYIIGSMGSIYKSTYMGVGWNKLDSTFTENLTGISVISKDTVFVTGYNKLYVSFDGGKSWHSSNVSDNSITDSYFTSSTVGHVGCSNGNVYKTIDGGKTWSLKSSNNSSSNNINRIYFVDSNNGFISRGYMAETLKTTDAGETWKVINPSSDVINSFFFLNPQNGYSAGEDGVIFKTSNGGSTWVWAGFQNGRYYGTDIYSLYFIDTMTGFAVGLSGRIMKTTDGGKSWNGYAPTYNEIKQLKLTSSTTAYGLVGNSFIKTTDGGNKWTNIGAPVSKGNTTQFDFVNENTGYCIAGGDIYSSASVGMVFKTTDGGKTWTATNKGLELIEDNLYSIDFIDDMIGYVSGGYNDTKTFKTIDGGNTWNLINNYSFSQIKFINPLIGYGRTYNNIYKTIDGGKTWKNSFAFPDNNGIASFDFTDENDGFLVGQSGSPDLYKTTDGGTTWQKVTIPYADYINIKFYSPNVGYITDDYGKTYQTSNGGASWIQLNKPYSVSGIELYGSEVYGFGESGVIMKKKVEYEPVVLTVNSASEITNKSVTLSGNVTSNNGLIKNVRFEYGIGSLINKVAVQPDSVQPNTSLNPSVNLKNLQPNQTYSYILTATGNGNEYSSNILQFTTLPDYSMTMNYVYSFESNEADVTGNIVSNAGDITNIEFQFGTDTTFTFNTIAQPASVSGGTTKTISAHLSTLNSQTRYYVRIKAIYNGSVIYSLPVVFTTGSEYVINIYSPTVIGNTATFDTYIEANKDTIRNIVFEYGTTREYKNQIDNLTQINKGNYRYISTQITGLDSATVYYYRIRATLGKEVIYSAENILKLKRSVVMIPIETIQVSDSSIILNGLVNGNGIYLTNIRFQYGLTTNLGDSIIGTPYYVYNYGTSLISSTLKHLTPGLRYQACISATNGTARYESDIFTFTLFSTETDSLNDVAGVSIYPNPAISYVLIKSLRPVTKVEIYDSYGKLVSMTENNNYSSISHLQKGIYFVRISIDDKKVTKKLIKN